MRKAARTNLVTRADPVLEKSCNGLIYSHDYRLGYAGVSVVPIALCQNRMDQTLR